MARFHINNNGDAGPCRADSGACPFGGEADHYETAEDARAAFEREMGVAFKRMSREEVAEVAEALTERFKQYVQMRDDLDGYRAKQDREAFDATVRQLRFYEARNWHGALLKKEYPAVYERACRGIAAKRKANGAVAPTPTPQRVPIPAQTAPARQRVTVPLMRPDAAPATQASTPAAASPAEESPVARARKKLSRLSDKVRHPYAPRKATEEKSSGTRTARGDSGPDPEFIKALEAMYLAKFGTRPEDDGVDTGALLAMFNKGELG